MPTSISAGFNSPFGKKESCETLENSEQSQSSDTGFSQPSCLSKSPLSSPEFSRVIPSFDSPSTWSFMEASCSLIHEEGVTAVSNLEDMFLVNPTKQDAGVLLGSPVRSRKTLNSSRSVPYQLNTIDNVTLHSRSRSSDFTLTAVDGMTERSDSGRTLGDASSSSFPQRSISASTAESDSSNRRVYVAALVKRRREIEEDLADLKVKLLESYREEWILTGVVPQGFAEIQSQVFAFDPKLKTTSFPFTHLLSSRSESNFRAQIAEKPSTVSLPVTNYGRALGIHSSLDEGTAGFNYKDSLTSFSSMMADSFYFCQSDDTPPRTCSFIENSANAPAREVILRRLEDLKNESAVVSQIYRVHRQRAFETKQTAFRKACKCNVQKLKEIQREKIALEAKLRGIDEGEQLILDYSELTRSSSVSVKEDSNCDYPILTTSTSIAGPAVATLPRRRTLRIPSFSSAGGTLRLGKLKKRSSLKQMSFESTPKTPIISSSKLGKISGFKALRFPLLPARLRMSRSHTLDVEKTKITEDPVPEMKEISNANGHRPYSMYATIYSIRGRSSEDDLFKSQLHRRFSASGPDLLGVRGSEYTKDEISPITPNELSRILGSSKVSISAKNAKDGTPSPSSDEQSTSGTFSMTSQEFSLSEDANICFRRPMGTNSEESPIRCICSCISEHGGNCDCSEENIDDLKEQKRVDSGVGQEEDETTPKPTRSKYPVIMPGRQHQQSLNPFYLLRAQSGRRNSLWKP